MKPGPLWLLGAGVVLAAAMILAVVASAIWPGSLHVTGPVVCGTPRDQVVVTSRLTSDGEGGTTSVTTVYCVDAGGRALQAGGWGVAGVYYGAWALTLSAVVGVLIATYRLRRRRHAMVAIALALAGGCSWGVTPLQDFDERTSLLGPLYLDGAGEAIRTALAGQLENPELLEFVVYPGYATFEARDPVNPAHYDRYQLRDGRVRRLAPLDVTGRELEGAGFRIAEAAVDRIPETVDTVLAAVDVDGGDVTHIIFERSAPGGPLGVTAHVTGPRGRGFVRLAADGVTVLQVHR